MQEGGKVNMKTSIQQSAILSINAGFAFERKGRGPSELCVQNLLHFSLKSWRNWDRKHDHNLDPGEHHEHEPQNFNTRTLAMLFPRTLAWCRQWL